MKKLNNKGFAISTMLYGLLIIIVLVVAMILSTMSFSRKNSREFSEKIINNLEKVEAKVCKKATSLHGEICTQTDEYGCSMSVGLGSKITYGNLGTVGNAVTYGQAFDCDVNNDGTYDSSLERFYYIGYTINIDNERIYYLVHSKSIDGNIYGNAISMLPSTATWPALTVLTSSVYSGRAARLLTESDINTACSYSSASSSDTQISLDKCLYLLEGTTYANLNSAYSTYWIYTEDTGIMGKMLSWRNYYSKINSTTATAEIITSLPKSETSDIRPVIEVKKEDIEF